MWSPCRMATGIRTAFCSVWGSSHTNFQPNIKHRAMMRKGARTYIQPLWLTAYMRRPDLSSIYHNAQMLSGVHECSFHLCVVWAVCIQEVDILLASVQKQRCSALLHLGCTSAASICTTLTCSLLPSYWRPALLLFSPTPAVMLRLQGAPGTPSSQIMCLPLQPGSSQQQQQPGSSIATATQQQQQCPGQGMTNPGPPAGIAATPNPPSKSAGLMHARQGAACAAAKPLLPQFMKAAAAAATSSSGGEGELCRPKGPRSSSTQQQQQLQMMLHAC